jgi:hypothetical protein
MLAGSMRESSTVVVARMCQSAFASRSITSQRPWSTASARVAPDARPLLDR